MNANLTPPFDTSITTADALAFFIAMSRVQDPRVTTNALKASLGIADFILRYDWAKTAFIPGDYVKRATGLSLETVASSIDNLGIVRKVANGRAATWAHEGRAAEYVLCYRFRTDWTPWPTNYLSPGHPQWDRDPNQLGPNAWRTALALLARFGLEPGHFTRSEIRADTGLSDDQLKDVIARCDNKFVHRISGSNELRFDPIYMVEQNKPISRPLPDRDARRLALNHEMKRRRTDSSSSLAVTGVIREPLPGESEDDRQHRVNALSELIGKMAEKDAQSNRQRIRPTPSEHSAQAKQAS